MIPISLARFAIRFDASPFADASSSAAAAATAARASAGLLTLSPSFSRVSRPPSTSTNSTGYGDHAFSFERTQGAPGGGGRSAGAGSDATRPP